MEQKTSDFQTLPLQGRRIVVTRAHHQAISFSMMLDAAGASVFHLPLIEVAPDPAAPAPPPREHCDWLIFTSANAVSAFVKILQCHHQKVDEYNECRIAAIGAATAAAAEAVGLHVDLVPDAYTSDALIAALLRVEPQPAGKRVLLPQSNLARAVIADTLTKYGMEVCALTIYQTLARDITTEEMAALLAFEPECIAFFSPSAVKAYVEKGIREQLQQKKEDSPQCNTPPFPILHASIGPVTTEALRRANCSPIVEASQQTEESLCHAIVSGLSPS